MVAPMAYLALAVFLVSLVAVVTLVVRLAVAVRQANRQMDRLPRMAFSGFAQRILDLDPDQRDSFFAYLPRRQAQALRRMLEGKGWDWTLQQSCIEAFNRWALEESGGTVTPYDVGEYLYGLALAPEPEVAEDSKCDP